MVVCLITRLKVLEWSMPSCWLKSLATRLALYLSMLSSTHRFIFYTHRLPITFIEGWKGSKDQVLLERKAWISSRTMPNLIPINIRECNGFRVRRRHYPSDKSGSSGGKNNQISCLRLPRMKDHRVPTDHGQRYK